MTSVLEIALNFALKMATRITLQEKISAILLARDRTFYRDKINKQTTTYNCKFVSVEDPETHSSDGKVAIFLSLHNPGSFYDIGKDLSLSLSLSLSHTHTQIYVCVYISYRHGRKESSSGFSLLLLGHGKFCFVIIFGIIAYLVTSTVF
jgi:hypothetical protein